MRSKNLKQKKAQQRQERESEAVLENVQKASLGESKEEKLMDGIIQVIHEAKQGSTLQELKEEFIKKHPLEGVDTIEYDIANVCQLCVGLKILEEEEGKYYKLIMGRRLD